MLPINQLSKGWRAWLARYTSEFLLSNWLDLKFNPYRLRKIQGKTGRRSLPMSQGDVQTSVLIIVLL